MYLKKEKISIWKWIGLFFGTMILFTILSRAIYQHSTAVVTTKMPTSGTINHTVQITGKTVQNQELAVTTIGGLRIASICVNEGQQVKQGDVLFVLDLDYLDEVILKQEQDMKKQQLSVWDAYAQNSNAQKQRENQQAQAEENYDNAVAKAQTAVDRAKRDLERAKTALENYRNGVTDDKAEEEALELACQEARTVYNDAFAALEALEQEIDQAVQDAISQAETELQQTALQSATQPPAETILTEETGSTEETTVPVEPVEIAEQAPIATELSPAQKAEIEASVRASYADRLSAAQASVQQAQQAVTDADAELEAFCQRQSSGATLSEQDYLDALELACQEARKVYNDAVTALGALGQEIDQAVQGAISQAETELQQTALQSATQPPAETILTEETGSTEETTVPVEPVEIAEQAPIATELSPAQKAEIEASVRASYADRLSAAQASVQQAQQAVTDADAELEAFCQRQSSGATLSEQDYLDAVEQAQEVYDDAVAALETTITTYGRAVSSANLPASTSNSAQIGQITYDQMKMELEKLEALQEAEGKILSPTDGIVTKCNVQTGEKTTDTTAILLADLGQGCKFSGLATEEDSQYIGVGDKVLLQTSNGKAYKDLPVTTFSTTEEPDGGYRLTVQIPSGNLALGANVNLSFTKKSQPYSCCVPLSALRLDNRNQTYVLVVQQVISVMGTELQAKKVNVTVLEQNETMVALAEGTLGSKDKVIVGSDKTIDIGSRVRVE